MTAAPETETDANGIVALLATHRYMPCSQHTPTVNAWWAQCEGCDWRGPRRSQRHSDEGDHRLHLAGIIADAARERVRVVEGERDAAQEQGTRLADGLYRWRDDAERHLARAESAEAAHEAEKAARIALADLCQTVIDVHANVVMDTDKDRELHARAIETFRAHLALLGGGEAR